MTIPAFKAVDFGEIDANAEHFLAIKRKSRPIFEKAFVKPPIQNLDKFLNQEKFLIYSQKGTGKSAILRHLELSAANNGFMTDYIIFKENVAEESDLLESSILGRVPEEDIINIRHYLHVVKRILLLKFLHLLISKTGEDVTKQIQNSVPFLGKIKEWFENTSLSDVSSYAIRSAYDLALAMDTQELDFAKKINFSKLLKNQNDTLLKSIISQAKKSDFKAIIFLDEIHFSFKDEDSYKQDAMLVRDCITAALNLNQSFLKNDLNCCIQLAVRSEFLEHPVIAQAEIQNQINSYGEPMDWSSEKYDRNTALWGFILERVRLTDPSVDFNSFFQNYVGQDRIPLLLEHTWSKPRDLVRFFNVAKRHCPNSSSLNQKDFDSVVREYSIESWREIRTALSSFLNAEALTRLEVFLGDNSHRNFENRAFTRNELKSKIKEINELSKTKNNDDFILGLLYILGIFQMRRTSNSATIYNAYHRANLQPKWDWDVFLHPAVARRFS